MHSVAYTFRLSSNSCTGHKERTMTSSRIINRLALLGALIVIFGVGSAANQAFAASVDLNSETATALHQ